MYDFSQVDQFILGAAQKYATDPSRVNEHTTPDNR